MYWKQNPFYYHLNVAFYHQMIMQLLQYQNMVQDQQHQHHWCWLQRQVLGPHFRPTESESLGAGFTICVFANTPWALSYKVWEAWRLYNLLKLLYKQQITWFSSSPSVSLAQLLLFSFRLWWAHREVEWLRVI